MGNCSSFKRIKTLSKITSLKRFKDDVNEVVEGFECGIGIEGFKDFKENDLIEAYELSEVKRKLK